jgi:hypothetical protein
MIDSKKQNMEEISVEIKSVAEILLFQIKK